LNRLGLIAAAGGEELIELNAALLLIGDEACALETLGTRLSGKERG
jgi:hypothetical protein